MVRVEAPHVHIVQARDSPHGLQQLFHLIGVNILWSTCMGRQGAPHNEFCDHKKKKKINKGPDLFSTLLTFHQYPENILGDGESRPDNEHGEQEGADGIGCFIFRLWDNKGDDQVALKL